MTVTELPRRAEDPRGEHTATRWKPSRAGILNVWRYYDEVFGFHNGRMLLRGPNGTGKSKALELLLPYLLDASIRPHRLSTFGTGDRDMWWNLMGEGATGKTRVGYVWLEFARDGGDGPEWFCCDARLQASQHTKSPAVDYFTTSQRLGAEHDVALTNSSGAPLTKAALQEALGECGAVHPTAADYRTQVRRTLYPELTEQRYDALITALLQLRQPKLSQRLDPKLLSHLLSMALPPLGQTEISELAEGFERLDRQREQLQRLDDELAAATTVARRQETYAQRVLRAGSATLISATTEMDNLTRRARESDAEYRSAAQQRVEVQQHRDEQRAQHARWESRIQGLQDSEEYRQGRQLEPLHQQARDADAAARSARDKAERAQQRARTDQQDAAAAEQVQRSAAENLAAAREDAANAAQHAGLDAVCAEVAGALEADGDPRSLVRAGVSSRKEQIAEVLRAVQDYETAVGRRTDAEEQLERSRHVLSRATDQRTERAEAYQAAVEEQAEQLHRWAESAVQLRFDDPGALTERAESESAVVELVNPVYAAAVHALSAENSTTTAQRAKSQQERDALAAEAEHLRTAADLPPEPPPTRGSDRSSMSGAPLWRLVSFRDGLSAETRAGVEAALQASGLLDAWVPADEDEVVTAHDVFLDTARAEPVAGPTLEDVLRPEDEPAVPAERLHRVLSAVACGSALPAGQPVAIGADGQWRVEVATGSWSKPEAAHIGAEARERARKRRLAELDRHIDELDNALRTFDERLAHVAERRRQLDQELDARPGYDQLNRAHDALRRAEADEAAADSAVSTVLETVRQREEAVRSALHALSERAAGNGMPAEHAALTRLREVVDHFRDLADTWLDRHHEHVRAQQRTQDCAERAGRSQTAAEEQATAAEQAEAEASDASERYAAVERTMGAPFREVQAEIGRLREQQRAAAEEIEGDDGTLLELAEKIGSLEQQRAQDAERRDAAVAARDTAAARLRRLVLSSLAADAGLDSTLGSDDGVRNTLQTARAVAAQWPNVPHEPKNIGDALTRLSESVHNSRDTLHRADLVLDSDEDVQVFSASIDGVRVGAAGLVAKLQDEVQRSRGDITERERELFDRTLTGDTRRHLADRIRQAGELVEQMNARLERVRTASDVAVRLVWEVDPDLPEGTKTARDLLLKDPVRLTDDDRAALHRFFRERIEQAREDNTSAGWEQQLAQVFDYAAWHRFVVKINRGGDTGWQPLTKKLHGALSGGEKAIALHLPLFAAVAAHYQSAPSAPRPIMLDEVFVGVDALNRGQVFQLLSSLDLDLVLTSDHEWCTYAELDGIAVHQLITGDDEAVTTARFIWDGQDLHEQQEAR
ncbi:TIGR02680 family protein [Bounagaea algeriensis]